MKDADKRFLFWLAVAVGSLALFGGAGYVTYTHYKQRGIRNNNPGNIRISSSAWKGKRSPNTDGSFEQFDDYAGSAGHLWGIRALFKTLTTYRDKHGLNTVRGIIGRWAPTNENNTAAYVAAVAKAVGKNADATLAPADYAPLIAAIIQHENGVQPYPMADITAGMALA